MIKRFRILLLVGLIIFTNVAMVSATDVDTETTPDEIVKTQNDNSNHGEEVSSEASENGLKNRATPAVPATSTSPAQAAVPAHKAVVEGNLLTNFKFLDDLSNNVPNDIGVVDTEGSWVFFTNSGADATFELDKKVAKIIPINVDAPNYGIQLIQSPLLIENLGIYKVNITAKAEAPRNITIKVGATGDKGWVAHSMTDVSLTTDMTSFEYEFTMYNDTDDAARFEIFLAEDLSPVWIESVSMIKTGEADPIVTLEELLSRTKTEEDENLVEEWSLVWADEFDSINSQNWTFEIGNGAEKGIPGWGNNELEYYTDSPNNAYIDEGVLVIQALEEETTFSYGGQDYTTEYTSARMVTENKVTMAYGRIEANIQVPSGQGMWAAFWMLGQDIGEFGWPNCGEIDILEYIGSNVNEIHGTVHGPITAGPGINGNITLDTDLSEDYHVYAMEWDEDEVEFYIDDILYHIVNKDEVILENGPDEWVYDHEYYLILNLAVGGNWPGSPDSSTEFPKQLKVDYIRIYEDVNPASIDGEEVIDSPYELPPVTPGIEGFVNGTFDDETGWTSYIHYDANGTFKIINNEAVFSLEDDGTQDYSAHLYQGPFLFEGTKSYTLEFDASAEIERNLLVVIDNSGYYRFVDEIFALKPETNTYSITFTNIDEEATLKFLVGELGDNITVANKIIFDNIKLTETVE